MEKKERVYLSVEEGGGKKKKGRLSP